MIVLSHRHIKYHFEVFRTFPQLLLLFFLIVQCTKRRHIFQMMRILTCSFLTLILMLLGEYDKIVLRSETVDGGSINSSEQTLVVLKIDMRRNEGT